MRRKVNSGAFTLVELLAVIGIMALLAAVGGIPSYDSHRAVFVGLA